jgi:hypothetical protein
MCTQLASNAVLGKKLILLSYLYPQNRNYDKRNNKCPINHRQCYPSWIFKVTISFWITRENVPSSPVTLHALFFKTISVFSWVRVTRSLVLCRCFFFKFSIYQYDILTTSLCLYCLRVVDLKTSILSYDVYFILTY